VTMEQVLQLGLSGRVAETGGVTTSDSVRRQPEGGM
jgi:hypothetical protein